MSDSTPLRRSNGESAPNIVPAAGPSRTLYVDTPGTIVRKRSGRIVVEKATESQREELLSMPAANVERVVLVGSVHCTSAAQRFFLREAIDLTFISWSGRLLGHLQPSPSPNATVRLAQYEAHQSPEIALRLARQFATAKLHNLAIVLRRRARRYEISELKERADRIRGLRDRAEQAESTGTLRGLEGQATRVYYEAWPKLVRRAEPVFQLQARTRQPPEDPINALLSFTYTLLQSDLRQACATVGLDPYVGFLHEPRHGCPSGVLDLMEAFRPAVSDLVTLRLLNQRRIGPEHFEERDRGTFLTEEGRSCVYHTYDERRQETVTPPGLDTSVAIYRAFEAQARLLARTVTSDTNNVPFTLK